jgi:hypothetical protein
VAADCSGGVCTFDASKGTTPSSGTTWSWTLPDGTTASGAVAHFTFSAAGRYPVTLHETTSSGTRNLAVGYVWAPAGHYQVPQRVFLLDSFARSQTGSWGVADNLRPWANGAGSYAVNSGTATMTPIPGSTSASAVQNWVSGTDADFRVDVRGVNGSAGTNTVNVLLRQTSSGTYRAQLNYLANNTVTVGLWTPAGSLGSALVPGATAGSTIHVDAQASGTGSAALRVRAWIDGSAVAFVHAVDTSAVASLAGSVGLAASTAAGNPSGSTFSFANVKVVGTAVPSAGSVSVSCSGRTCAFGSTGASDPDGTALAGFRWTFSDGAAVVSGGSSVSHTFAAAGSYLVTVTITDQDGKLAVASAPVSVS